MMCLALDMATNMGWAAGDLRGSPEFGSQRLGEPGSSHGARFFEALDYLKRLVLVYKPRLIALEAAIPAGPKGGQERAQLAMGYRAQVHVIAFRANAKIEEHHVSSIRKHFIGHGGTGGSKAKTLTMDHCLRLNWPVDNDNEADALALWDYVGCLHGARRTPAYGSLFEGVRE